jgi:thioesterase domain-containing protein
MTDPAALARTESFLHLHFPLSIAMGVRVESHDEQGLVLTAPLELNHNHLGTAFGGSLGALALFAGYGLLWLEIGEADCHIVIRSSAIRYEKPVHGRLRAICHPPQPSELEELRETYRKKGKARILLRVSLVEDGEVRASFDGVFVVMR